ncbi:hypothetical protein XENOCAPTIV_010874 [Xenoophorus captivus]|uniref:Uncharacterized protein n=1 Tax=Xenoophorus captivus TaxID=1517983 RepID=A0ABV0RPY5_9TELE
MHTTTTRINTTFELAEAGLGSFHTPVRYFPSVVGGREREWALGSDLGDCLVLGLAFRLSLDCLGSLGSRPLALGPDLPAGGVPGFGRGVLAGVDWDVAPLWWRGWPAELLGGPWCAMRWCWWPAGWGAPGVWGWSWRGAR